MVTTKEHVKNFRIKIRFFHDYTLTNTIGTKKLLVLNKFFGIIIDNFFTIYIMTGSHIILHNLFNLNRIFTVQKILNR